MYNYTSYEIMSKTIAEHLVRSFGVVRKQLGSISFWLVGDNSGCREMLNNKKKWPISKNTDCWQRKEGLRRTIFFFSPILRAF